MQLLHILCILQTHFSAACRLLSSNSYLWNGSHWILSSTHITKQEHTAGGGDQPVVQHSSAPRACAGWVMAGVGGRAAGQAVLSGVPSWDSQESVLPHGTPSHLSAKLGTVLASIFMIWYINEMGNVFPWWIIILMLMLFILLLTYNRVQVIKLYVTYAALKSVTGEK